MMSSHPQSSEFFSLHPLKNQGFGLPLLLSIPCSYEVIVYHHHIVMKFLAEYRPFQ